MALATREEVMLLCAETICERKTFWKKFFEFFFNFKKFFGDVGKKFFNFEKNFKNFCWQNLSQPEKKKGIGKKIRFKNFL